MFSAFQTFGKLGALASSVARAWSPLALWPDGISSAGMWISPQALSASWADYTGTTPVATPGTVADSSNPVGLALDIRAGATVLTDPGLHMLQSTSAARPLLSARVNLLTNTSRCDLLYPTVVNGTVTSQVGTAPDGSLMALFAESATTGEHLWYGATNTWITGLRYTFSTYIKPNGRTFVRLNASALSALEVFFNLSTGETRLNYGGGVDPVFTWEQLSDGIVRISASAICSATGSIGAPFVQPATSLTVVNYAGDGVSGFYQWGAQINLGSTALPYQRVNTASDYDASAGPTYQKYDGVDDSMATAAFAAGTLINGMDCMIAVRRDSAASCVAGLYNGIADATKFFGMAESASGSGCVGSGAGTPTVWVDNTQLTGGTAVTRGTLHTALTVGDWHILEFRNLDLSTWTASGFGLYTSYVFPGPRGDILLYPSTTSTEDKDAARQWLADYYGVTLP